MDGLGVYKVSGAGPWSLHKFVACHVGKARIKSKSIGFVVSELAQDDLRVQEAVPPQL